MQNQAACLISELLTPTPAPACTLIRRHQEGHLGTCGVSGGGLRWESKAGGLARAILCCDCGNLAEWSCCWHNQTPPPQPCFTSIHRRLGHVQGRSVCRWARLRTGKFKMLSTHGEMHAGLRHLSRDWLLAGYFNQHLQVAQLPLVAVSKCASLSKRPLFGADAPRHHQKAVPSAPPG